MIKKKLSRAFRGWKKKNEKLIIEFNQVKIIEFAGPEKKLLKAFCFKFFVSFEADKINKLIWLLLFDY